MRDGRGRTNLANRSRHLVEALPLPLTCHAHVVDRRLDRVAGPSAACVERAILPPPSSKAQPQALVCSEPRPPVPSPSEPHGNQARALLAAARATATPLAPQQAAARDLLASLTSEEGRANQR